MADFLLCPRGGESALVLLSNIPPYFWALRLGGIPIGTVSPSFLQVSTWSFYVQ